MQEIIQLINEQNSDIVLSAGDFVSGHIDSMTMPIDDIAKELQNDNKHNTNSSRTSMFVNLLDEMVKNKKTDISMKELKEISTAQKTLEGEIEEEFYNFFNYWLTILTKSQVSIILKLQFRFIGVVLCT